MVMNVLEEHFGSVYTGHQMTAAVGPGQIVCAEKTAISNLHIIHSSCIVSLCYKKSLCTRQAIHSRTILHYALV